MQTIPKKKVAHKNYYGVYVVKATHDFCFVFLLCLLMWPNVNGSDAFVLSFVHFPFKTKYSKQFQIHRRRERSIKFKLSD